MTDNDLNEQVNVTVDDASVITVPIDATLQNSNEAADAKAVGDALALKADKSELQAAVKVNNQPADAQGLILIDGRHIPVSDQDTETLANAVTDLKGKTAADIPMSSDSGAKTIAEVVNANSEAIEGMEEMTGATMPIESGSQTTVKAAIEARVKTVNRKAPDADGDVDLSVVPLAENLQSDKMESVEGSFIIRTTGGNASVSDGKAYPLHLFGSADHAGYVAEQLNMTVIPITRTEPDEPITATIDRDTFVAYVDESSTINLYYTTEWSADPELYGITVTGTPEAGDQITVVYVKEVRGTITVANPARLVGTGWNLFDYNNGYARVVKYSTEYGYKIGGSYASLQFSATLTGERSSITPGVDGLFNVPSDGYVFVTGGNNTDTYILTTWSDWMEGPSSGYWEPYRESGIDLSAVMTTYFPNGLLAVGATRDEIDLSAKRSISRIERMAYSEENRAAAAASGRSYDFDQNYIYIVRESAVISAITIDTTYNVSEHGLEWFTETTLPVISEILYGKNLRDKLERDVVTISAQTLTEEEKAQVRTNIGAMSQADGDKKLVAPTTAGTAGQLLHLKADGGTEWTTQGTPTDAQVGTAVSAWLTAHPEATTTVQDGAISRAKLNDDLKAKTDAVPDLKSAIDSGMHNISNIIKYDEEIDFTIINDGNGVFGSTGTLYATSLYNHTDYIYIEPFSKLSYKRTGTTASENYFGIAFYDKNKTFISGANGASNQSEIGYLSELATIDVPSNAVFIRATVFSDIATYGDFAIYGSTNIRNEIEAMKTGVQVIADILKYQDAKEVAYNTVNDGKGVLGSDGTIYASLSYNHTDYIYIEPFSKLLYKRVGTTASTNYFGVAFYDKNKTFISGANGAVNQSTIGYLNKLATIDVPSNAVFIRATVFKDTTTYGDFEVYGETSIIQTQENLKSECTRYKLEKLFNISDFTGYNDRRYGLQSVAYNTSADKFVFGFSVGSSAPSGTKPLIVETSSDYSVIQRLEIENGGHMNDITYVPEESCYYIAISDGNGNVLKVDADDLSDQEIITIQGIDSAIIQFSYDKDNHVYYATLDGIVQSGTIYEDTMLLDSEMNVVSKYTTQIIADMGDSPYTNIIELATQGSVVMNGEFLSLLWIYRTANPSYGRICSFDNNGIYNYIDAATIQKYDEPEALEAIGGKLYMFAYENENTLSVIRVYTTGVFHKKVIV